MSAIAETTAPARLEAHDAPYHIGAVTLRANDLAKLTAYYRDAIGLQLVAQGPEEAELGIAGKTLVRLRSGATRPSCWATAPCRRASCSRATASSCAR